MPAIMKLSSVYSTLPSAEKKVADFILSNPNAAAHMVINEIAEHVGVSVPSVTRLAKRLGYKGFMDFRISLVSNPSPEKTEENAPISSNDADSMIIQKLMAGHMTAIESTLKVLDTKKLMELVSLLVDCQRVIWFGVGNCIELEKIFSDSFVRMDIDSTVIDNRSIMRKYAELVREGDVVIAITRTGKTQHTLDCLKAAKARGATTVLMTNLISSIGEQYADYFICTSRQNELFRLCGYETFTSIYVLLETIVTLVEKKKGFASRVHYIESMIPFR